MLFFGFMLTTAFIPVFPGAGTTPRWMVIAIMIPLLMLHNEEKQPRAAGLLLAFVGYAALSLLWAPDITEGAYDVWRLILTAAAFVIGAKQPSMKAFFIGCGFGMMVNSAVVIAQVFDAIDLPQTAIPGGLFMNKNFGGEAALLILIGCVGYRRPLLALGCLPTLLLSNSKAAWLAAAVVFLWMSPPRYRWWLAVFTVFALGGSAQYVYQTGLGAQHIDSLWQRIDVWRDVLNNLTVFGHGAGSFYTLNPQIAFHNVSGERFDFAHNDFLQLAFEYGVGAIPLLVLLALAFTGQACKTEQAIVLAFIVEACFGFPLHLPVSAVIALVCAGAAVSARHHVYVARRYGQPVLRGGDGQSGHAHGGVLFRTGSEDLPVRPHSA